MFTPAVLLVLARLLDQASIPVAAPNFREEAAALADAKDAVRAALALAEAAEA